MDIKTLKSRNFDPNTVPGEYNLVEMWSRPRLSRITAGIVAGLVAAVMMLIFGTIYCVLHGMDITFPMKIAALPILGRAALEIGSLPGIVVGLATLGVLSSVLGGMYAHFTGVNHKGALFGMGLTWGAFGWVFITNLFMPSFRAYYEAQIPSGVMFFAWMVFGLSLMSVSFFDRKGT